MNELLGYVFSPLREEGISLYRGSGDGLAPILLVAAEETSPERLEHEYALRAELEANWAARPVALTHHNGRMTLVLEDPGGAPLDRLLGRPMEVSHFLRIAIPVAKALRQVHERGLIHKDIKPATILVDAAIGGAWLPGFGIASRLPREHQPPAPPEVIAGTLAYMAPEQTGRMNRSVDSRSDLYALSITLNNKRTALAVTVERRKERKQFCAFTGLGDMLLAPHRQARRSHRSIHCWHRHAARRSALPRERFSPVTLLGHRAITSEMLDGTSEYQLQFTRLF